MAPAASTQGGCTRLLSKERTLSPNSAAFSGMFAELSTTNNKSSLVALFDGEAALLTVSIVEVSVSRLEALTGPPELVSSPSGWGMWVPLSPGASTPSDVAPSADWPDCWSSFELGFSGEQPNTSELETPKTTRAERRNQLRLTSTSHRCRTIPGPETFGEERLRRKELAPSSASAGRERHTLAYPAISVAARVRHRYRAGMGLVGHGRLLAAISSVAFCGCAARRRLR